MQKFTFEVRSESSGEVYAIEAWRSEQGVHFTCSCAAGIANQLCKHRINLFENAAAASASITSGDAHDFASLLTTSNIGAARQNIAEVEARIAGAQAELKALKKQLGRMLAAGDGSTLT